ncbi:hypothetical protein FA15DRAFT_682285 [Coprinopsis marcescibilis]|uniref:Uncharacterized protein n=1 Tax=Coprinopsis marcescibilis TaxID=230819 RepID=A0A5C3KM04_COPMA|nr:hypothetical protein FA15DRAFT_682285 [Coprinopsis marcescibilis]
MTTHSNRATDPLMYHGRHFGHTIRAFCRIHTLLWHGINTTIQLELGQLEEADLSEVNADETAHVDNRSESKEYKIYCQLLGLSAKLEEQLMNGSETDIFTIANLLTKGASNSRSDDTRALKVIIVAWITPPNANLVPPLKGNVKTDRGFYHDMTGKLLCPATMNWEDTTVRNGLRSGQIIPNGDQWPLFLYQNHQYNHDKPWNGLMRGHLLIEAFKHTFTSPSSVENPQQATQLSNSSIHGMKASSSSIFNSLLPPKVRFALSSSLTFTRTDTITDSERLYNTLLEFLEDPEEHVEVKALVSWWNM